MRKSLDVTPARNAADSGNLLAVEEVPEKARVAILGNVDTGKSSLCQWLLGRTDVCKVTPIGERTTTTELATGHWFNNPAHGELEVLDTPGFTLNGDDGVDFISIVNDIKAMGKIDAIIMTSSLSGETGSFRFKTMTQLRHTFGSAMWENMVHFLKVSMGWRNVFITPGGYRIEDHGFGLRGQIDPTPNPVLENHLEYWSDTFLSVEKNESTSVGVNWNDPIHAEALKDLEDDISSTTYQRTFGARLVASADTPMSSADNLVPPDIWTERHIGVSGIADAKYGLVGMRNEIIKLRGLREGGGQWDVTNLRARFGPSSVTPGQAWVCKWPHSCNMTIKGDYLSEADKVRIFPLTHTCGTAFAGFGAEVVPVTHNQARPRLGDGETEKFFDMGATISFDGGKKEYRVCYCEYGNCDGDIRYHQEAGVLSVEDVKCPVACEDPNTLHATLKDGTCGDGVYIRPDKETLTYECSTGYGINNDPTKKTFTQTCNAGTGTLTPISPCPLVHCKTPPATPGNAHRVSGQSTVYVYGQPLIFQCNSYAGDYEARKHADPTLTEEGEKLITKYTVDADPYHSQRIDIRCGADGEWGFNATQAAVQTYADFNAEGGCRRWETGEFGTCSATCGPGSHTRPVTCNLGPGKCAESAKPSVAQPCSSYAECADCGKAPDLSKVHAKRSAGAGDVIIKTQGDPIVYQCDYHNGYTIDGSGDTSYSRTNFQVACKLDAGATEPRMEWTKYTSPSAMTPEDLASGCRKWETTPWSDCSVSCGSGLRSRKVQCSTGDDNDCAADAKPQGVVQSRSCYEGDCASTAGEEALSDGKSGGVRAAVGLVFLAPLLVLLAA